MPTEREIPRADWSVFCDDFTRRRRGSLVAIDVFGRNSTNAPAPVNEQDVQQHGAPLEVVAAIPNPHGQSFIIQAGDGGETTRLLVARPVRLRVQESDDGEDVALWVDAANGQTTRLALDVASRPPRP